MDRGRDVPRSRVFGRVAIFSCFMTAAIAARPTPAISAGPAQKDAASSSQTPAADVDSARRKAIAEESASLLKMATDLKAEVDKSNKDTLSLSVIRKAEEIEKLARSVRDKVKPAKSAK
jgi:hypothetical protein